MNSHVIFPIETLDSKITFKGNFIKDVTKDLKLALNNQDINCVQDLSIELHVSGTKGFNKWLETILEFYIINIGLNNIYVIPHIYNFIEYWCTIDDDVKKKQPLDIVNDQVIRNFIFFMNWILCPNKMNEHISNKIIDKKFKIMNMTTDDLNFKEMKKNNFLVSKNLENVNRFLLYNDPKEIILPLSEICELLINDNIKHDERLANLCYWFSWLLYYERTFHKNKWNVQYRDFKYINDKFKDQWIVIFLQILIHYSELLPVLVKRNIFYLIKSYSLLYNTKNKKTFAHLILLVFKLMINPYNLPTIDQHIFTKAYGYSLQCNFHYMNLNKK
jgi:hypothetical protein